LPKKDGFYFSSKILCFLSSGEDDEIEEQAIGNGKAKNENDLRGHLNGLYNGLATIMTTTCQVKVEILVNF